MITFWSGPGQGGRLNKSFDIDKDCCFFGASAFEGRRGKASLVFVFFPPPSIAIGCGVNKKKETETTGIDARGHSPVG